MVLGDVVQEGTLGAQSLASPFTSGNTVVCFAMFWAAPYPASVTESLGGGALTKDMEVVVSGGRIYYLYTGKVDATGSLTVNFFDSQGASITPIVVALLEVKGGYLPTGAAQSVDLGTISTKPVSIPTLTANDGSIAIGWNYDGYLACTYLPTDAAWSDYIQASNNKYGMFVRKNTAETVDFSGERLWAESGEFTAGFALYEPAVTTPTLRKSSTFDIETTLGTVTTATLNGVNVFDHVTGQVGTTVSFAGAATDEITTSGEYSLVLGDGVGTETITVQVNVVGLASFNINKDGADQGSLTDVEFIILTGAAGSRAINQQVTGITTDASGNTGPIEITDTALAVDDTITVVQQSPTVGGGVVHSATLGLI